MGAQGKVSTYSNSMQRVKVYHLSDTGKWNDRGTGHVTIDYMEGSEDLGLFVLDEEDNEALLSHRISADDIYRRQDETIISWRDPDISTELALSFQESSGCSYIWDHICSARRNMQFDNLNNLEIGPRPVARTLDSLGASHENDESFRTGNNELRDLPPVELSTLPLILKTVVEGGAADHMRVSELILQDDFFPKLMELFHICEDLENSDALHMIFRLVKGIILLNSPQIFDKLFADDIILDVIGALEYDPDVPQDQQHRTFLKEHVVFREAIPIKDPLVLSKIHQTYRVGYIKDVILPRVLDEATVASLSNIIHANNAQVVSALKDDTTFIQELFARMKSCTTSHESKKNLVLFLHEFCSFIKNLQMVQQLRLFRDLAGEGIFDIITDVLQSQDKRLILTGTDILLLFLNQDSNLLRTYVIQQENNLLLGLLVNGMVTDFGEDMNCQFLEIIRMLLDSYTLTGSQKDTLVEIFFDKHLDPLIDVITISCRPKGTCVLRSNTNGVSTRPEILSNICELLCFCVLHHPFRIKYNFLKNNTIEKVLLLTHRREKYLVVSAVRFLRTIISRNDDQLHRHISKNNLMKPIVEVFVSNGNRYNLLNSSVLELFEYIRKESIKPLIIYVVDSFWNQLAHFSHFGSIQSLKIKYEQCLDSCETRNTVSTADTRKRIEDRALDKEEEDYFNEDSDEEDSATALVSHIQMPNVPALPNGTSGSLSSRMVSGGLVDYEDDDDDDYDPPPRNSKEPSVEDDTLVLSIDATKSKRKSTSPCKNEDPNSVKKQKTRVRSSDLDITKATSLSTPPPEPPNKKNGATEEPHGGGRSLRDSSCLPNNKDKKLPNDEDHNPSTHNGNSLPDMSLNGAKSTGSKSYSVR